MQIWRCLYATEVRAGPFDCDEKRKGKKKGGLLVGKNDLIRPKNGLRGVGAWVMEGVTVNYGGCQTTGEA